MGFPASFGQIEEWTLSAILLSVIGLLVFASFYGKRHFTFRLTLCDVLLFLYLVYLLFRLDEYLTNPAYFLALYTLTLLYIIVRVTDKYHLRTVLPVLVISLLFQAGYAFYTHDSTWSKIPAVTGVYRNTGIWGGFAGIVCVGLYGRLLFSGRHRFTLSILFVFSFIMLACSRSRAAWVGSSGGFVFLSFFFLWKRYGSGIIRPAIMAVVLSVPLLLYTGRVLYQIKPVSADGRIYIWKISSRMLSERPWTGMGIDKFKSGYMYYQAAYFSQNPDSRFAQTADDVNVPFSEPLKTAIEQGIIGLAFFLSILVAALIPLRKKKHPISEERHEHVHEMRDRYIYAAVLITLLVFSCFSYPFLYIQFLFLLITCLAFLSRLQPGIRVVAGCKKVWLPVLVLYLPVACYVSFAGINCSVYLKKMHNRVFRFDVSNPGEVLSAFAQMEPVLGTNPNYLFSYANILSLNREYGRAIEKRIAFLSYQSTYQAYMELGREYEQSGDTARAISCWQLASDMIPNRFEPLYLQIGSYHRSGQHFRADSLTALFLQKERKVDAIRIDRMLKDVREWSKERNHYHLDN